MAVGAAGLQLIAEHRLLHDNVHHDGQNDGHQNTGIDLGAGEQLIQSQLGCGHTVEGGLVDVTGLCAFCYVLEAADIKHPGDKIGCDPVGHDAGQHLVDIQQRLQQSGDRTPQGASQHTAQKGQQPDDAHGHGLGGDAQRDGQRDKRTHQILAGCADIEQARLEGHRHGKAGHDQRHGAEEHIAHILGVKAPGQRARSVAACAEDAGKNQPDALPHTGSGDLLLRQAHNNDHDAAQQQAGQDGQQRGQDLLGAILGIQICQFLLHAVSPSFLSARLAPAI